MDKSITFICPALNEEALLERTLRNFIRVVKPIFPKFEILIFNDGSTDSTGEAAEKLADEYPFIRVFHNKKNKNIGYCFNKGVKNSKYNYVKLITADAFFDRQSYQLIYDNMGKKDIIIPYVENIKIEKKKYRYAISRCYNFLINKFFGLDLIYHNGLSIFKKEDLLLMPSFSNGFFFLAEYLTVLIKEHKVDYVEIPCRTIVLYREDGERALSLYNVLDMFLSMIRLKKYLIINSIKRKFREK